MAISKKTSLKSLSLKGNNFTDNGL